jgi:hypothetical protein
MTQQHKKAPQIIKVCSLFLPQNGFIFRFYITAYGKSQPSVSEEELKEKQANINGNVLDVDTMASSTNLAIVDNTETSSEIADNSQPTQRGMVLPFAPLSLTFDNIKYSVDMPQVTYFNSLTYTVHQ